MGVAGEKSVEGRTGGVGVRGFRGYLLLQTPDRLRKVGAYRHTAFGERGRSAGVPDLGGKVGDDEATAAIRAVYLSHFLAFAGDHRAEHQIAVALGAGLDHQLAPAR